MSGDEMIFDPTMSKKKKKKKKPFMLDEEGDAQTEETQPSETKEVEPEPTEDKDVEADEEDSRKKDASDDLDDLNFFNQKKKKKKSKKIFDIDEAEEGIKDLKIESDVQEPAEPEEDLDIMLGNKKKKKKVVKFPDEDEILEKDEALEDEDSKKDDGISFSNQTGPAWAGSERDYTYEELLNRVFNIMREKNPDMVAGEKRKFVMKPPQVVRVGTKKTSFVNFTDICKLNIGLLSVKGKERKESELLSRVRLFATAWTIAHQVPPSLGFSRQEYWSGLPFPFPGDLLDPRIKPRSPTL
ncbi:eukaryotic translation initiation factor 2 subunit 2 isoform X2 [Ovis aries]|uniref:eukaryotic translation initiation factor 2 subunit 2 isoform X2 n=1 Tax=Ovis aries TaxID=9940 RepID=UPI0029527B65|nr:eukaryotic translation initiation factor 2 subunit 2 isoform X2 [Ovis aries]